MAGGEPNGTGSLSQLLEPTVERTAAETENTRRGREVAPFLLEHMRDPPALDQIEPLLKIRRATPVLFDGDPVEGRDQQVERAPWHGMP